MKNEKLQKVNELRGLMLGIEMNLKLLDDDLESVDMELIHFQKMESDLIYNINLHKSGKVITVVREYRRSIDELKIIKDEIIKYKNFRDTIMKKMEKKLESHKYYLDKFEQAYEDLNSESVILLFRKDKKREQKED